MKLLVLTTSYPSGPSDAAGAFVAELSGVLQERGFSITTVAMELPGGPLAALEQGQIWSVGAALARMSVKARWAAAEADAILAHWLLPSALLGVALGRPTIGVAHGGDVRLLARMPWLRKALVTRLAGVVAVSREAGAALEALNTLVTPMGVHAADFGPPAVLPPGPLKALFIGRLVPIKGLPTLLAAMSRTPEATLTVVGAGPEARLAARASSNVTFVGAVGRHALGELLASHHVVCLPSRAGEGTPRVVLEAYAAGRPVLASAVGGIPDVVSPQWCLPSDDVAAWSDALGRLAADPKTCVSPVAFDRWDWQPVGRKVADFIDRVVGLSGEAMNKRPASSVMV